MGLLISVGSDDFTIARSCICGQLVGRLGGMNWLYSILSLSFLTS